MTAGNFSACKDNRNNSAFKNVWCTCDDLYVQEKEQKEKVEELRQEKEDEQKDVDRLEDRGLTALFYSLIGKIDEKMTKEQKEAYAASVK